MMMPNSRLVICFMLTKGNPNVLGQQWSYHPKLMVSGSSMGITNHKFLKVLIGLVMEKKKQREKTQTDDHKCHLLILLFIKFHSDKTWTNHQSDAFSKICEWNTIKSSRLLYWSIRWWPEALDTKIPGPGNLSYENYGLHSNTLQLGAGVKSSDFDCSLPSTCMFYNVEHFLLHIHSSGACF